MADFELKFEAEDVPAPGDYSVGKQARGKVEQEEVIGIALTGFELGDRLYSISFDIEDDREAYNTLVEAASEDELRESDEVQIGYRDDSGEHQRTAITLEDDLPEDLSEIGEVNVGELIGDYSPGINGSDAVNPNLFTFSYNDRSGYDENSDEVYESLGDYIEALHPNQEVSDNAEFVASRVQEQMQQFEEEISQRL
jgi:hypothetical protein